MAAQSEVVASLRRRGVAKICHMTPCDRLPLIRQHGAVLSLNERRKWGIQEPKRQHYCGAWGRREALGDYVCCAFRTPWGILNDHGEECAVLVFEAEPVCATPGTLFCPTNTARSQYTVQQILGMSDVEAFDACFPGRTPHQAYQDAEILVPRGISLLHLRSIVFCDDEARDYWLPRFLEALPPVCLVPVMRDREIPSTVGPYEGFKFPPDYAVKTRVRA